MRSRVCPLQHRAHADGRPLVLRRSRILPGRSGLGRRAMTGWFSAGWNEQDPATWTAAGRGLRLCRTVFFCATLGSVSVRADNWPAWRGVEGLGITREKNLPLQWSATENVRSIALPDRGNSSPIVWRNRVFITQALEKEQRLTVMCFDRAEGKLLWQAGTPSAPKARTHRTNPYCSSSPVTDGERVLAWFGSAGLFCFDLNGRELWHRELGKQSHIWGYGSSPIIYHDLCILNFGPGERSFLIALDKKTGETVWQVDAPPLQT